LNLEHAITEVGETCYIIIFQEQEMEKQKLLFHQARLANRGVAEMVLLHISACKGVPSDMVMTTLQLGIAVLRGGNVDIQMVNHSMYIYIYIYIYM
jgi:hypothetical protein